MDKTKYSKKYFMFDDFEDVEIVTASGGGKAEASGKPGESKLGILTTSGFVALGPDGKAEASGKSGKPKGYWTSAHTVEILKAYLHQEISEESAALELGCTGKDIRWHAKDSLKKGLVKATEGMLELWEQQDKVYTFAVKQAAKALSGIDLAAQAGIPFHVKKASAKKKAFGIVAFDEAKSAGEGSDAKGSPAEIQWAEYLGIANEESWDLRTICAMFYASEHIASYKGDMPWHVQGQFYSVKSRSVNYVSTWADRFGKYALAACLGEFRHRQHNGNYTFVKKHAHHRSEAQAAAMKLWLSREKTISAVEQMAEGFRMPGMFSGGFGGKPWAKIAETLNKWLKREIPDLVWADYVWDLSHNGGRFFDKCHLFKNEEVNRALLTAKRDSKSGDVREWGRALLHKDWLDGLELIEMADLSKQYKEG